MHPSLSQVLWFVLAVAAIISLGISYLINKVIRKQTTRKPDAMETLMMLPHRDDKNRVLNDLTARGNRITKH